jgi:adenylate kinase family enzyme
LIEKAYVLFGPPGAGKTVVLKILVAALDCQVVSMSGLIKHYRPEFIPTMAKGGLIPDEVVIELLSAHTPKAPKVAFDGAPRTKVQSAFMMDKLLKGAQVISFGMDIPEEESRRRVLEVRTKEEDRSDAKPEVFERRMDFYKLHKIDVVEHLKLNSRFVGLNARVPIPHVRSQVFLSLS